eukprot:6800416-Lingulodinium_polyedra.AAC.1
MFEEHGVLAALARSGGVWSAREAATTIEWLVKVQGVSRVQVPAHLGVAHARTAMRAQPRSDQ